MTDTNRNPDRYSVPAHTGHHDISPWIMDKPFFLASAIKRMWRGYNSIEDLSKAVHDLRLARLGEIGASFYLMAADLHLLAQTATPKQREHLKFMSRLVSYDDLLASRLAQAVSYEAIDNTIRAILTRMSQLEEFGEAVHGDVYRG